MRSLCGAVRSSNSESETTNLELRFRMAHLKVYLNDLNLYGVPKLTTKDSYGKDKYSITTMEVTCKPKPYFEPKARPR